MIEHGAGLVVGRRERMDRETKGNKRNDLDNYMPQLLEADPIHNNGRPSRPDGLHDMRTLRQPQARRTTATT